MANFHALERMVDNAVGSTFSERLKFVPQVKNAGRPDPERSAEDITGVLHYPDDHGDVSLRLGESRSGVDTMVSGVDAVLVVERAKYPDLRIFKNDLMRALEAPGEPWYKVNDANTSFSSIVIVHLVIDAVGVQ